jgi:hypothetical protein
MLPPLTHVSVTPSSGLERTGCPDFGFLTREEGTSEHLCAYGDLAPFRDDPRMPFPIDHATNDDQPLVLT